MTYDFLIETYETERPKVLSVWSEFSDADLPVRPRPGDPPARSANELLAGKSAGGAKSRLPGTGEKPVTERPARN
jgi:hypothetical protein